MSFQETLIEKIKEFGFIKKKFKNERPHITMHLSGYTSKDVFVIAFNKYYLDESYDTATLEEVIAFIKENRDRLFKEHAFANDELVKELEDLEVAIPYYYETCMDTLDRIEFLYGCGALSVPLELEGVCLEE